MSVVIETEGLTKKYEGASKVQDVLALDNLNLQIVEGEIFGYLGPNGSGKTTTIKMLLGLIFPTAGNIKILDREDIGSPEVKRNIGYLPEGAYYPDFLKGEEVLRFYGQLYGLRGKDLESRIDHALEIVGMTRARKRLIRGYSKGMRQRIGLAQALIPDPKILILDEPTTGLDPIARKEIRDILVRLRNEGKTLLISSHELLEVEMISNRVGILFEGVLQTIGTIQELLTERDRMIEIRKPSPEAEKALTEGDVTLEDAVGDRAVLRLPASVELYEAVDRCRKHNVEIISVAPRRMTLEELFVTTVSTAERDKERAAAQ